MGNLNITSETHEIATEMKRLTTWTNFMTGVKSNEQLGYPAPRKVIEEVYGIIFCAGNPIPAIQIKK